MAEKIASLMATLGKEQKVSNHCHSKHNLLRKTAISSCLNNSYTYFLLNK